MNTPATTLPMPRQIGFAVRDADATMRHYRERFGLTGTVQLVELNEQTTYRYRGLPARCLLKIGVINLDSIDLEFIEVVEGEHPALDHLQAHGEGVNHLGFFVDDFAAALGAIPPGTTDTVIEGTFDTGTGVRGRYVYLENRAGGPMYEVMALEA